MPPYNTYANFPETTFGTSVNGGMTWNTSFFPASGDRDYSDGKLYHAGSYGYTWMSTPKSTAIGYTLGFLSGGVHPNNVYPRAAGKPVRCISE